MGTFDRLTGVLSKDNFYGAVKEILQVYPRKKFELLRTDIERFKIINEIFGEDAGDRLLRIVSQSLQKIALCPGAVGRLHSDHFVILKHTYSPSFISRRRVPTAMTSMAG